MFAKSHLTGRRLLPAAALVIAAGIPAAARAAPGTLAQVPLFVSVSVKPNIFFVLDDSLSMRNEVIKSAGARTAHGNLHSGVPPIIIPDPANNDESTLALCAGYNVLAYNPTVTYTPWAGMDDANAVYGNRDLASACTDPYDASTCTQDISDLVYFEWTDNGDGDYDLGECPRPFNPDGGTLTEGTDVVTPAVCAGISGCVTATGATAPSGVDPATNFANWYSYYRNGDLVQKRAVSEVVFDADQRVGLATLNNEGNAATPVRDLSDTTGGKRLRRDTDPQGVPAGAPVRH